jgi:hypothetical protein
MMVRILAAVVAAGFLAGCSTLPDLSVARVPTAGPIEQGPQLGSGTEGQFIRVIARPPRPGMTRAQVVQGFLDASASFDGDHAVARQFLTDSANSVWRPGDRVAVYEGLSTLTEGPRRVTFRAAQSGDITDIGRFEVSAPGTELVARFELVRVDGEWRISDLPRGLLLSNADVERAYRAYSLYFFDPNFEVLVPDARLIPVFGPGRATTLVRFLLDGPNSWLQPAVRTGFPSGVGLAVESVPVDGGVARIDLTTNARLADERVRRVISQQLVWTLRQLPDVTAVDILAGGQPLTIPGVPRPQPRDTWPAVDPAAIVPGTTGYVSQETGIVRLAPAGTRPAFPAVTRSDVSLVDIAISQDGQQIGGADVQGRIWQASADAQSELVEAPDINGAIGLAFDGSRALWAVLPDAGLAAILADGSRSPVLVLGLASREQLLAAYPSRDGTRVAMIVRGESGTFLRLGRILRTVPGSATDVVISAPIRVESRLTEVLDVAWAGPNSLLVLGSEGAGLVQVFEVEIARGLVRPKSSPELPAAIAAAPGLPNLAVNTEGVVFEFDAGTWVSRTTGTSITYPN